MRKARNGKGWGPASVLPAGYSKRYWPFSTRSIAKEEPSDDHSAHRIFSNHGRICPPKIETRDNVPAPSTVYGPVKMANSFLEETEASVLPSGRSRSRDSGFPGVAKKTRPGLPSQFAE